MGRDDHRGESRWRAGPTLAPAYAGAGRSCRWLVVVALAVAAAGSLVCRPTLPLPPVTTTDRGDELDPKLTSLIERHVVAARRKPHDARERATLGLVYEANKLWPEARSCFQNATVLQPNEPMWPYHAAIAWQEMEDPAGATAWMLQYAERFPDFAPLQHRLGVALLEGGKIEEAEAAFRKVIASMPEAAAGHTGLGDVTMRQGDHAEAARILEKAARLDPGDKATRYLLGLAYRRLGRPEDAKRELVLGAGAEQRYLPDAWTVKRPEYDMSIGSQQARASRLLSSGRPKQALQALERILADHPDDLDALINKGAAYVDLGRLQEAIDILLRAKELDSSRFEIFINFANCYWRMGRPQDALRSAEEALALAPELAQTNHTYGLALMQLGRNEEALAPLTQALGYDARNPKLVQDLANVYARLGRYDEAATHFQSLASLLPGRWEPQFGAARANLQLGRLDEAEAALQRGLQLAPNEPRLHALARRLSEVRER